MMKKPAKVKKNRAVKRDLFSELKEGIAALAGARQGKRTLRTHAVECIPEPALTPEQLIRVRKELKISRALFAAYLRTNVRTLENWEQGRAKPNAQGIINPNLHFNGLSPLPIAFRAVPTASHSAKPQDAYRPQNFAKPGF